MRPMIDNAPVGLVTSHTPRMPKLWRVTCGTHSRTDTGAEYPDKLRHPETGELYFQITRPGAKADKGHIPKDEAMQKAAEEVNKSEYPTWLPIFVLSNFLSEVMRPANRATFWGSRRWCYCERLWAKTRKEAELDELPWLSAWADGPEDAQQRGLPWPPPDTLGNEAYYHGFYVANDAWGPKVEALSGAARSREGVPVCDPSTCPIALGTHGINDKRGNPKFTCKPHIVISFRFNTDVMELPPGAPPWAYVASTGWNTHGAMTGTWNQIAEEHFPEGSIPWMVGLPLRLRLGTETRTPKAQPKKKVRSQKIPVWSLEPHGSEDEILAVLEARSGRRGQIQAQLAEGRSLLKVLPESTDHQASFAREMHPKAADGKPSWQVEAEAMMTSLGWSGGQQDAEIQPVLDGEEEPEDLLARLREQVEQENGGDADASSPADESAHGPARPRDDAEGPVAEEGGAGDDVVHEGVVEPDELGDVDDDAQEAPPTGDEILAYRVEHDIPLDVAREIASKMRAKHHPDDNQLVVGKFCDEARIEVMAEFKRFVEAVDGSEKGEVQPTLPVGDEGEE